MTFLPLRLRSLQMATVLVAAMAVCMGASLPAHAQQANPEPWKPTQETTPAALAALLTGPSATRPLILQVGFDVLYRSKHIPGSIYAGPASTPEGLKKLRQAVSHVPKTRTIYLYCGCCPLSKCPNIRPAFQTLQTMGFSHVHVVMLESNFGQDWVAHGYPVAGASASTP